MAQRKGRRYPAGIDGAGNSLTVVEVSYPKRAPNNARCLPGTEYVLEKAHDGRVVSAETVVRLCQTEDQAEITVSVEPNRIEVNRNGGTQAGYFKIHAYQLSPWRPVSMDDCSFYGSGEHTLEQWDFLTLRGEAWYRSAEGEEVGICEASATLPRYLIVPSVAADAAELEKGRGRLGSCAMSLDSSGKHGFVTWGKPDPRDPLEVKLLQAGKGVLLAQVVDAGRTTAPARSWVMADHLEVWMGSRLEGAGEDEVWQFGIPLDEGPVQVGYGKPRRLPVVRRWKANLPDGRAATLLRVELPPQPNQYSDGLTVSYSQGEQGRAQKRMIATSRVKRGVGSTMGRSGSVLIHNSVDDHVTCGLVNGALEITGAKKKPLVVPEFPVNR
ncbi:hypothetical protein [Paludibaculum fermentans]|uniref:Uncharacterized protein n=1 Tax=Paludibaculum fermentans TaxID=1473598 RepID=A0A7S7SK99_PALFE|nr:hypothetical protein [Paludibaculum fermentans]QOY87533.1 hypothetical protein IRI77_33065 [Paludibaculum fermentans]